MKQTTWYTITTENSIKAHATEQEARDSDCRFAFADRRSLETIFLENPDLAATILTDLPGQDSSSVEFSNTTQKQAARLIWEHIQPLAAAVHPKAEKLAKPPRRRAESAQNEAKPRRKGKQAGKAKRAAKAPKSKKSGKPRKAAKVKAARPALDTDCPTASAGPRPGTKAFKLVKALKREKGVTLAWIMNEFGWLAHTTRGLLSAGGALAKQGIKVESFKPEGGERTYRIAS